MMRLGVSAAELTAIFVTHEHGDHIKGVGPLSRKFNIPVYTTSGTYHTGKLGKVNQVHLFTEFAAVALSCGSSDTADAVVVTPVAVPHDAREPAQFVIEYRSKRMGVLTDLGHISAHVKQSFKRCDALLLEANHCTDMLQAGPYPVQLKQRVGGNWGHLNNHQSAEFFEAVSCDRMSNLVLGHISRNNNSVERVREVFEPLISKRPNLQALYACQDEGFDWISVANTREQASAGAGKDIQAA